MTRRPPWRRIFGYDPQGRRKAVALLVAVLALAPLVGSAVTAGAASSRVTNDRTFGKGNAAALSFDRTTAKTCADGSAGNDLVSAVLVARQNVTRSDGTELATKSLFLNVNRRDTCTDSHTASFGSLEDAGVVYEQSKTDAANVSGVIPMQDILTGAPAGAAAVDLSFTSVGQPVRTSTFIQFSGEGTRIQIKSKGMFSDATVTGSMTLNGDDLLAGAEISAFLGTDVLGTIARTKVSG